MKKLDADKKIKVPNETDIEKDINNKDFVNALLKNRSIKLPSNILSLYLVMSQNIILKVNLSIPIWKN